MCPGHLFVSATCSVPDLAYSPPNTSSMAETTEEPGINLDCFISAGADLDLDLDSCFLQRSDTPAVDQRIGIFHREHYSVDPGIEAR